MQKPIRDFTDILAWQEGHKLVLDIYRLTKKFPKEEIFGLVSQMRRAAVSVTSNIAEGFGRQGYKEKIQFFYVAQGSLIELKNQLLIARDIGYISIVDFTKISEQADQTHKLLQGLITKSKSFLLKS
jgi:four helix bundle protein